MTISSDSDLDAAGAAERVISGDAEKPPKRRGRPPGSKTKKKRAAAQEPEGEETETEPFVPNLTPGDIQASTVLAQTAWGLIAPFAKLSDLSQPQAERLGEALAPLIQKYLPLAGQWQYEINAAIVVVGVVMECRKKYVEDHPPQEAVIQSTHPGQSFVVAGAQDEWSGTRRVPS